MAEQLGGHVLLEVVGTGAHSTVHRARSTDRAGRIVAIKRVRADAPDEVVARVRREGEVLADLAHPAIVPLLDVLDDPDGGVALVLPYAPGGSLEDVLARRGALPWPEAVDLGARLASALSAAHGAGVLHRDVKPANVLLGAEAEPRLADFGTVVLRDGDHLVDDGVVLGTAEYVDPAVAVDGQEPSPRSDGYALGVLLYRVLSGQLPHAGGTPAATLAAADRGVHAPLRELTDAPDAVVEAVERAMARRPEDRFGSVQQLGAILEAAARDADSERWRDPDDPPHGVLGAAPEAALTSADVPEPTDVHPGRELPEHPAPGPPGAALPAGDSGTRLFGPRPNPGEATSTPRTRPRWAIPALVAVVVLPVLVVAGLWLGSRGGAPEAAPTPSTRQAPPRCDEAAPPPTDAQVLDADVDGRGCSLPLVVSEEAVDGEPAVVVAVPEPAGELAGRYAVAAGGDQVVVGDWDCDGTDTPGVYRPADGSVYLYDGYGALDPTSGPVLATDGTARVVTTPDGCDEVVVDDPAAGPAGGETGDVLGSASGVST